MAEIVDFSVASFKSTIGGDAVYTKLRGKFKETDFESLLNEKKFSKDILGRSLLRAELLDDGFSEGIKGNYFRRFFSIFYITD